MNNDVSNYMDPNATWWILLITVAVAVIGYFYCKVGPARKSIHIRDHRKTGKQNDG